MAAPLRRIVTGHDARGRSVVVRDGAPRALGRFFEMWATEGAPAGYGSEDEVEGRWVRLEPPERGTIFRLFRVDPEDPRIPREELERRAERDFSSIDAGHCLRDTTRHPTMHETRTVDYIILLQGRVTLVLEEDEVDLEPFDVVIQRGTNHAWVNRGPEPALLAAILIDAEPRD
ncbi:MAG TPA: cupin domain-containing protein [Longimicrobiales bacterium]|nr:cupin domain-containing protein [Longimicrobiales bacterium]